VVVGSVLATAAIVCASAGQAQEARKTATFTPQVTGVLGSPDATTNISGKQLLLVIADIDVFLLTASNIFSVLYSKILPT
jgi:hypothetical protein